MLAQLAAALLGVIVAGFVIERVFGWAACLWMVYDDYRIAVTYPHLGRPRRLLLFVPLIFLHSGPWALGVTVFMTLELFAIAPEISFWFAGGFLAFLAFVSVVMALWWKHRTYRDATQRTAVAGPLNGNLRALEE